MARHSFARLPRVAGSVPSRPPGNSIAQSAATWSPRDQAASLRNSTLDGRTLALNGWRRRERGCGRTAGTKGRAGRTKGDAIPCLSFNWMM